MDDPEIKWHVLLLLFSTTMLSVEEAFLKVDSVQKIF